MLAFWNKIRAELNRERVRVFDLDRDDGGQLNIFNAVNVLKDSGLTAEDTFIFFDTLFDIA